MTEETTNTGNWNTGNWNTGDRNTGHRNTGNWNTGDRNTGHWNTGDRNTGNRNTGYCNTGYRNTGYWNTGDRNTGDRNTGNRNTGYWNTGYRNTGHWNTGDRNTGYCNTITPEEVLIFNKLCSIKKWEKASKPDWMYARLTQWITEDDMTKKEKESNPSYITTKGYLKFYSNIQHAYIEGWEKASKEDRELTFELPNFDIKVFKEIFGFTPTLDSNKKIVLDGKEIEISEESFNEFKKQFKD